MTVPGDTDQNLLSLCPVTPLLGLGSELGLGVSQTISRQTFNSREAQLGLGLGLGLGNLQFA